MASYDQQVYESLGPTGGASGNYVIDANSNLSPQEIEDLKRSLQGGGDAGLPPVGLDEALSMRRAQQEAQGWMAPTIYPDVMPNGPSSSNTFAGRPMGGMDYRGASQVGGYAGPTRPSDKPYDYAVQATPQGVDAGRINQVLGARLPNPSGSIQTVGQLRELVAGMKGAPQDVIEGLVASLTGIDNAKNKANATAAGQIAVNTAQGDTAANATRKLDILQKNAELTSQAKTDVARTNLFGHMDGFIKEMGARLGDPLYKAQDPNGWLAQRNLYHQLLSLLAQGGFGMRPNPPPVAGQQGSAAPVPGNTGQARVYQLPGGVTVTAHPSQPAAPAATGAPAQAAHPVQMGGGQAGSFANTPQATELHNKAVGNERIAALAYTIAQKDGYNAPLPRHYDEAKRQIILQEAQRRLQGQGQ